ncbi:hypothetical protein KFL_000150300 [Klebsormidium nitens]|uniref:Glycosyltransferase subfamily 4-like N-terminal domain-containing protein n=1 Tax=Klebsormidium nitens TaxID=105231 RepID=A0A1Y1HPN6_KLENI|nr:hypothetical protein KFL_000150300 [Klebsormidium nitens]|eukprot:GAQ78576.1 hypothetical protein KFL_000150300 [Klebsormidium nitens]
MSALRNPPGRRFGWGLPLAALACCALIVQLLSGQSWVLPAVCCKGCVRDPPTGCSPGELDRADHSVFHLSESDLPGNDLVFKLFSEEVKKDGPGLLASGQGQQVRTDPVKFATRAEKEVPKLFQVSGQRETVASGSDESSPKSQNPASQKATFNSSSDTLPDIDHSTAEAAKNKASHPFRIALLSSYTPQRCGLAEATHDLYHRGLVSAGLLTPRVSVGVIAVDEGGTAGNYSEEVAFVISKWNQEDYVRAADVINRDYDVLNVHHEYGIFGGDNGEFLLALLSRLTVPVVTNLHTVPTSLSVQAKTVVGRILHHSARVQVFLPSLCDRLRNQFSLRFKCSFSPRGVPSPSAKTRQILSGGSDEVVIVTPGPLAPAHRIEHMIEAMKIVRAAIPQAVYHVQGDLPRNADVTAAKDYVSSLRRLAESFGVEDAVRIEERFAGNEELTTLVSRASLVVTPYIDRTQVSSDVLALAVALERPAIATPFEYARWLCNRTSAGPPVCALVPFQNPGALAAAAVRILRRPDLPRVAPAAAHARGMLAYWPELAARWVALLRDVSVTWQRDRTFRVRRIQGPFPKADVNDPKNDESQMKTDGLGGQSRLTASQTERDEIGGLRLKTGPFRGVHSAGGAPPLERCTAQRGADGSFYATNSLLALHGRFYKGGEHRVKHTLLQGSDLVLGAAGVRYGGAFLSARSEIGQVETRLIPDVENLRQEGRGAVLGFESLVFASGDESAPVARVSTSFRLQPKSTALTLEFRVEAMGGCLADVEIISGMDCMSSTFPGLTFDTFRARSTDGKDIGVSATSAEATLFDRTKDGVSDWSIVMNRAGDFGVVTVPRNESLLSSTFSEVSEEAGDVSFHYVASRYALGEVCSGLPKSIVEEKILVSKIDVDNWSFFDGVVRELNPN